MANKIINYESDVLKLAGDGADYNYLYLGPQGSSPSVTSIINSQGDQLAKFGHF